MYGQWCVLPGLLLSIFGFPLKLVGCQKEVTLHRSPPATYKNWNPIENKKSSFNVFLYHLSTVSKTIINAVSAIRSRRNAVKSRYRDYEKRADLSMLYIHHRPSVYTAALSYWHRTGTELRDMGPHSGGGAHGNNIIYVDMIFHDKYRGCLVPVDDIGFEADIRWRCLSAISINVWLLSHTWLLFHNLEYYLQMLMLI